MITSCNHAFMPACDLTLIFAFGRIAAGQLIFSTLPKHNVRKRRLSEAEYRMLSPTLR
jgi:hypothetical protein